MARDAGSRAPGPDRLRLRCRSVERAGGSLDGVPHALAVRRRARRSPHGAGGAARRPSRRSTARRCARPRATPASQPSLRRVLNATGVIVHTNLGRAPLAGRGARRGRARRPRATRTSSTTSTRGERGSRHAHVEALLRELTGAEAAIAVNNCAAAVLLAAAALAGRARGRGLARAARRDRRRRSGSPTWSRSRARGSSRSARRTARGCADYERAHRRGDRRDPARAPVELPHGRLRRGGRDRGAVRAAAVAGDRRRRLGRARRRAARCWPTSRRCGGRCAAGARARLLLRRQAARRPAGRADGRPRATRSSAAARHPLARALRIDKLSLAALEATLRLYRDPGARAREVPVLRMLAAGRGRAARRARERDARRRPGARGVVAARRRRSAAARCRCSSSTGPVVRGRPGALGADALARALRAATRRCRRASRDGRAAARPAHARRRGGRRAAARVGAASALRRERPSERRR